MESTPLPPDPYKALGVAKDADAALIKSTYRKLVLKCHPDKVTDESLKQQKQEEFHKIQQAYELIGDEEKRSRYDAEVHLEALRRERPRGGGAPEVKTARYDIRTQAPSGASFTATGAHRYEEHKSSRYEDRYQEERSRKFDTYDAYPKHSTTRSSREKEAPARASKASADRTRSDYKKSRDKDDRREREKRFVSVESDSSDDDVKARYEADYRRRNEDARKRAEEDEARRAAADARRKAEEHRRHNSYDVKYDDKYDRNHDHQRKMSAQATDAVRYMHRSKVEAERPSPNRTNSSRDVRPDYYDSRSRRDRPEAVRRSSARPTGKDRPSSSSGRDRDRKGMEIVDWEEEKRMPAFKHSSSSPADLHVPRTTPQRSYTESSRDHRRPDTSPTPVFRRSETMPSVPHSSSRRKDATLPRPSTLRESSTAYDSPSTSPDGYPTVPNASSTKKYYYPTPGGGVSLRSEDVGVANGHRTVLREPDRQRHRSPSPLTRPPMGANRPAEAMQSNYTTAPKVSTAPPPLSRSATINVSPVRGNDDRARPLYGEINSDHTRRENARRQTNFSPDKISYSHKIGPDDIRWSASRARDDREYSKPTLGRHATYVY